MVIICPGYNGLGLALFSTGDNLSCRQDLNIIVKLLVCSCPVGDIFGDVRNVFLKLDVYRPLGAVSGRLDADIFKPLRVLIGEFYRLAEITKPVGVHRAVKVYSRDALFVWGKNTGDNLGVTDAC